MKRLGLLFLLLILASAAVAQDGPPLVVEAALAPHAPQIDGRLSEAAWNDATVYVMDRETQVHENFRADWSGSADLSARLRVLRHGEDLYLGFDVRDDALLHESGRDWWIGDSIEVFFNTDLQSEEDDTRYSNDDLQLFLMPFHDGLRWGVVARGPDRPYPTGGLRGLEVAHERTDTGYTMEVRIPFWDLEPLRPDDAGRIGFDVAINDVDVPGSEMTQSYMTLSGRFDLYSRPENFAYLRIGAVPPAATFPTLHPASPFDWTGVLVGLAVVLGLALLARRAARRLAGRTRTHTVVVAGAFAVGAALLVLLPDLVTWVDDGATRNRWGDAVALSEAAARAYLDLDTGTGEERARGLLTLLRDGQVRIHPDYDYEIVPLSDRARQAPVGPREAGPIRFGIELAPGEARRFPLLGQPAPPLLRLDTRMPEPDRREPPHTEVLALRLEFASGAPLEQRVPRADAEPVLIDLGGRAGEPLHVLEVRNLLPVRPLVVDALYGKDQAWVALPLAHVTPAGVPIDVWQGGPTSHILDVPSGGAVRIDASGRRGDRLWIALGTAGAYPRSAYGADVVGIRVFYADEQPGPTLQLVNGRDVVDPRLASPDPTSIALQWLGSARLPRYYTLHVLELDESRPLHHIEVTDVGVLAKLDVAAATVGRRAGTAPPPASRLRLRGDRLSVQDDARAQWQGLGFAVRAPDGSKAASGRISGVPVRVDLPFGGGTTGSLEAWLPRSVWAQAVLHQAPILFGLGVLLFAFGAVMAGAVLLQHARHLRVKMLVALGAATVVPLLFLVVSLTRTLNERAERELEDATRADLRHVAERIDAGKARARELAYGARDAIELLTPGEDLGPLVRRSREEIEAQGAFLRLPGFDTGPAPMLNVSFIDGVKRSGLYYSPWDGVLALGLARTAGRRPCVVGLPALSLLGPPAAPGVSAVLFDPTGVPLAAPRGVPPGMRTRTGRAEARAMIDRATRSGQDEFVPLARMREEPVAAAYRLLRDGGHVVGLLGVYRSRAETRAAKEAVFRTVLLSALAALLLVVIAGGTLVDRVTDRLQRVTRAARSIATGDLSSRVPVEADDEVGRLAASFNTMADALDERAHQLSELHRGLHELTAALDRAEVAQAAADLLARTTGAKYVLITAIEPVSDKLETLHRRGEGAPLGRRLPESGPARDAVELKRTVVREGAVFLPLVAAGRTVGLALCSPVGEASRLDRAYLDASGRQIGIALENARLYHAAVTDELTGLYTHSFFVRRLKEEVDRAAATGRPLSILRVVIQDFRNFARSHGAAAASKLVAETAATIEQVLPRRNMLGHRRPGELLALLVESDANAARRHLDRIAAALDRHDFAGLGAGEKPSVVYRSVTYPRDGAAADILLDSLFELTESWEDTSTDMAPMLTVPAQLGVVLGRSPTIRSALDVVTRVAPTNATVLLSGETGAGKEIFADLIQANSDRRDKPYVKVNCAAIPETLIEAELFGHEKGAFTGADRRRIGRFEEAHRGTLFLDEIGDIPLPMQIKLLRVLQERRIQRVGGNASFDIDVRIITASNRQLSEVVRRGEFREDLYHRLHVIELRVPSLRERREDIPHLIEHFRLQFNRHHSLRIEAFAPDALDALYNHDWPGNVRELKNVVERSMLMTTGATVLRSHVALPLKPEAAPAAEPVSIEGLTPRQERILARARREGGITNSDVVSEENVSARTALRELQRLVERGLLHRVGRRRGAVYRPPKT